MDDYDEFDSVPGLLEELALPPGPRPASRLFFDADDGARISAIRWGEGPPEIVFLHGSGQNAHTWDAVALLIGRPALAIDLPGHGHSSWRADRNYSPHQNAESLAPVLAAHAPDARMIVGMSLGGSTTIRLAATHPERVRRAVLVDITPGSRQAVQALPAARQGSVGLISGPRVYDSFDAMVDAAVALNPGRPMEATRRGVRNNAKEIEGGRWTWRYDRLDLMPAEHFAAHGELWDDVSRMKAPTMLVRGGQSAFVRDEDAAEMRRRQPGLRLETVPGAGHSVQSHAPAALARLIEDFGFQGA